MYHMFRVCVWRWWWFLKSQRMTPIPCQKPCISCFCNVHLFFSSILRHTPQCHEPTIWIHLRWGLKWSQSQSFGVVVGWGSTDWNIRKSTLPSGGGRNHLTPQISKWDGAWSIQLRKMVCISHCDPIMMISQDGNAWILLRNSQRMHSLSLCATYRTATFDLPLFPLKHLHP